jgi:hypothetical protein
VDGSSIETQRARMPVDLGRDTIGQEVNDGTGKDFGYRWSAWQIDQRRYIDLASAHEFPDAHCMAGIRRSPW